MSNLKETVNQGLAKIIAEEVKRSGTGEILIREGKTYDQKEPRKISIDGIIDAPAVWTEKRPQQIDPKKSYVTVNYDAMIIELVINENSPYYTRVSGQLQVSQELQRVKINSGEYMTTYNMSEMLKMNKALFKDKQQGMLLVSQMRNFEAKVTNDIKDCNDNRGNTIQLKAQAVESNTPGSFVLSIPLFKGLPPVELEVEIYINAKDLTCTLVSSDVVSFMDDSKHTIIDAVLGRITAVIPDIPVLQI